MAYRFDGKNRLMFENNKVGRPGKGRKIHHVQTILVSGDERNRCHPVIYKTIIHKNQ